MSKIIKCVDFRSLPKVITPPQPCIHEISRKSEADAIKEELSGQSAVQQEQQALLDNAAREAEMLIAEAREMAEKLKQDAYQEGYRLGFEQGRQEGQASLNDMAQTILAEARLKADQLLQEATQQANAMLLKAEEEIIHIALAAARKILKREIDENPMTVLPVVKEALAKAADQDYIVVRAHPDDTILLEHAKIDLQHLLGGEKQLSIVPDSTIGQGGCLIETRNGTVDATIDTQFALIQQALRDVIA